ncbi:MAG: hypothetical protein AAB669_01365 [Patescibacteria group bacterium]
MLRDNSLHETLKEPPVRSHAAVDIQPFRFRHLGLGLSGKAGIRKSHCIWWSGGASNHGHDHHPQSAANTTSNIGADESLRRFFLPKFSLQFRQGESSLVINQVSAIISSSGIVHVPWEV